MIDRIMNYLVFKLPLWIGFPLFMIMVVSGVFMIALALLIIIYNAVWVLPVAVAVWAIAALTWIVKNRCKNV